jgi:hypothetical protein
MFLALRDRRLEEGLFLRLEGERELGKIEHVAALQVSQNTAAGACIQLGLPVCVRVAAHT